MVVCTPVSQSITASPLAPIKKNEFAAIISGMIKPDVSSEENLNTNPNFPASAIASKDGTAISIIDFTVDLWRSG
jgi:hypothetical protein